MKISFTKRLSYSICLLIFVLIYTVSAVLFSLLSFVSLSDGKLSFQKRLETVKEIFSPEGKGIFDFFSFEECTLSDISEEDIGTKTKCGYTVILDPGHGGPDPGAIGVTGEAEKLLNYSVAEKTANFLRLRGVNVIMTREDDLWLADENALHKKHSDVTNRVKFCRENENDAFVSIHMNSFSQESCKGTQIFFSPNSSDSRTLAETVKNNVISLLQPENKRETKESGSSIYILDRIETCAILIECGFISNYDEAVLLNNEEYQNKLAFVIAGSIYQYLNTNQ